MPYDIKALEGRIVVDKITTSVSIKNNGNSDFVSLSVMGEYTLGEAALVHKLISRNATQMVYLEALAKGHLSKTSIKAKLPRVLKHFEALIEIAANNLLTDSEGEE